MPAQGNALGGYAPSMEALKGRDIPAWWIVDRPYRARMFRMTEPKALPWAGMGSGLRPSRTAFLANMPSILWLVLSSLLVLSADLAVAQQQPAAPAAIDGVKGVKQEAVESVKKVEPPAANPAAVSTAQGVKKVDGIDTINGVKAAGHDAVQPIPPPPPAGSATNVVGGAVGAVSTIRAVKGVQGIIPPKQLNLEAALLIKEGGAGTPAGGGAEKGGKGKAAAAALLTAPAGLAPAKPIPNGDGRAGFQEFEKGTTPGS